MNDNNNGDWGAWSRHVLAELQRLNNAQQNSSEQLQALREDQMEIKLDLREHMRRTAAVETANELNRAEQKRLQDQITPLSDQAKFQRKLLTVITGAAGFGASCMAILKALGKI